MSPISSNFLNVFMENTKKVNVLMLIPLMLIIMLLFSFSNAFAATLNIDVPNIFANNMVLQRDKILKVWGTGTNENAEVKVQIAGQTKTATISNGKWSLELDPMSAGGPYQMTITCLNDTITKTNILVGEVWLASGQSNMFYVTSDLIAAAEAEVPPYIAPYGVDTAAQIARLKSDMANSADSKLRLFTVSKSTSSIPLNDVGGVWYQADPTTVGNFSSTAYYFARELRSKLDGDIPVGIVAASRGGTSIERWVDREVFDSDPQYATLNSDGSECDLYNAMIYPIKSFGFKGVIWYQGEQNSGKADLYAKMFPALINSWRKEFQQSNMPFLFVNLAPSTGNYTLLREAQLKTLATVQNTAMAVITDAGDPTNIHPKDKKPVGERLAQAALAKAYGKAIEYSGPIYKNMRVSGNKIILSFNHIGTGLMPMTGTTDLRGFEISADGSAFVVATAQIVGDTVEVSASTVLQPIAVRYGWWVDRQPITEPVMATLYNKEGFPAAPFRASAPVFKINTVNFYDSNNIEITNNTLPSSGDLNVKLNYNNKGILSSKLLIATYDNEKELVNCNYFTPMFDYTNSILLEKNIDINAIRNGGKVRIMVWDDMTGIMPITDITDFPSN